MTSSQSTKGAGPLKVLVLLEGEHYVAQCLDYDIAAQGKSMGEVRDLFLRTFIENMLLADYYGDEPQAKFGMAPREYWDQYEQATQSGTMIWPLKWPESTPARLTSAHSEAQLAWK